jgi:hypothetical protein
LPGFTTAWFSAGKLLEVDQSWPDEILHEIAKFQSMDDRKWRESYLAVIGPMFAKYDSREMIADNLLVGIRAWIKSGQLRSNSSFVSETITLLGHLSEVTPENSRVQAVPTTAPERLIARAMQLSLHISSGPSDR